ncbi:MAG TPA: glycosyltransferase family 9 protein, partial [Chloroflexota bacterium]
MERFQDQPLRAQPHIAVVFYDKIGDFVVATPLLRGLREKYPGCTIDYFSGERTRELEEASPLIDWRYSLFGASESLAHLPRALDERIAAAGPYDLAINCESHAVAKLAVVLARPRYVVGPCFTPDGRGDLPHADDRVDALHDEVWNSPTLLERYGDVLQTQYIGEILCRLARVETDFLRTEVPAAEPPIATPPVLIATGGNRSAKLWPLRHWERVIRWLHDEGLGVGLLGSKPSDQQRFYHSAKDEAYLLERTPLLDLRGKLTLPQVAGALQRARLCLTIDNGIMHLALAVRTPTVALFGASPWRLWAPPVSHLHLVLPAEPCNLCEENRFRNDGCLLPRHLCMESITPGAVIK